MTAVVTPPDAVGPAADRATVRGPRTSAGRVVTTARVMLGIQATFVAWVCFQGFYYFHDDFVFRGLAAGSGWFDPAYLFHYWGGHLMPAAFAVAQPVAKFGGFNYALTATTLALGQLLVGWLLLRLLLRHFGARWRVLVPFALYLTSIPVLQVTEWWAAALNSVPLLACLVLVSDHTLRTRGRRSWREYFWIVGTFVTGLLFFEKAVLLPFAVVMLLWAVTPGGPVRAASVVIRRHWPLIAALVAVEIAWVLVYRATQPLAGIPLPSFGLLLTQVREGMLGGFLPSLFGGPWSWYRASTGYDAAATPVVVQAAVAVLTLVVVVLLALRGARARRSLLLAAGYATLVLVLINVGRQSWASASSSVPRYFADVVIVVVVSLALATARLVDDPAPTMLREWSPRRPLVTVVGAVAFAQVLVLVYVSAALGLVALTSDSPERVWVTHALSSMRAGAQTPPVLDEVVPGSVVWEFYYPLNTYGWVFAGVSGLPEFGATTDQLRVLDAQGYLVPGHVVGPVSAPTPGSECGYHPDAEGIDIPMVSPIIPWAHTMQIAYIASARTTLEVGMPNSPTYEVTLQPGLHDLFLQFEGGGSTVHLRQTRQGVRLCVGAVRIGQTAPGTPT